MPAHKSPETDPPQAVVLTLWWNAHGPAAITGRVAQPSPSHLPHPPAHGVALAYCLAFGARDPILGKPLRRMRLTVPPGVLERPERAPSFRRSTGMVDQLRSRPLPTAIGGPVPCHPQLPRLDGLWVDAEVGDRHGQPGSENGLRPLVTLDELAQVAKVRDPWLGGPLVQRAGSEDEGFEQRHDRLHRGSSEQSNEAVVASDGSRLTVRHRQARTAAAAPSFRGRVLPSRYGCHVGTS